MMNFFQMAHADMSMMFLNQIFGEMDGLLPCISNLSPSDPLSKITHCGSITMLSTMFSTFNTIVLSIGALIIVYMTVVGVMKTAHEGEFMGKKWNNIWLPIRTVLGVAMLVPTASGYSVLQHILMWVVVQGIAAADTVWNTALTARAVIGSPYKDVNLPSVGAKQSMQDLFKALVCDSTSRLTYANPSGMSKGGYYCADMSCTAAKPFDPNSSSMAIGPNGICGTLTYCSMATDCRAGKENSVKCLACQAQLSALASVIPTLSAIADQVANADYNYRDFYAHSYNQMNNSNWQPIYDYCDANNIPREKCCQPSVASPMQTCQATSMFGGGNADNVGGGLEYQNPSDQAVTNIYWPYFLAPSLTLSPSAEGSTKGVAQDFIGAATDAYMGELTAAYSKYITLSSDGDFSSDKNVVLVGGVPMPEGTLFQQASDSGWIVGGTYYYIVARESTGGPTGIGDAVPNLNVDISPMQANLTNYRSNVGAVDALLSAARQAAKGASDPNSQDIQFGMTFADHAPTVIKPIARIFQDAFNNLFAILILVLQASGGPIVGLTLLGNFMLTIAATAYALILTVSAVISVASMIDIYFLGTGFDLPLQLAVLVLEMLLMPIFYIVLGWFAVGGALLAVYIPMIPYVVFAFGVLGWFIAVIEMMVAAPLVALGILSPSGQHELMGKAEPAIGMMLNIFLRPSLMLFGMMAAMLLSVVVCEFIFFTFWQMILFSGGPAALVNPIVLICFITAMIVLILAMLNKCFALIHILPSQVLNWIGVHHQPGISGGSEAEGTLSGIKGSVKGKAEGIDKGVKAAGSGMAKFGKGVGNARLKQSEKTKEAQSSTVTPAKNDGEGNNNQ